MANRTVAVQTIIFGKGALENLPGVLDAVAAAGYQAVETGFWAPRGVAGRDLKKMLDDRGLTHVGSHFNGAALGDIGPVIDWLKETGGTDIPISDLDLRGAPLDVYRRKAAEYNDAGRTCRRAGITLSYHNHSWELAKQDGVIPLEILYDACDANLVKACVDTYWIWDGQENPAAFVRKHAARIQILHCKDSYLQERGHRSFAPVGSGVLDFAAIAKALDSSPCPWIVVEQDTPNPGTDAATCITASRKYLRELIGV